MRVLITLPNLMLQEGLALVLGGVAPQAILNRVHKKDLLQRAAEGEAPALVLIGYPWISLATLEALQVRLPDAAVIVLATNIDTAVQRRLLASHVAAIVPVSTDPDDDGSLDAERVAFGGSPRQLIELHAHERPFGKFER